MVQPLPQDLPEIFNASAKSLEIQLAYSKVLEIEKDANSEQDLVCARVIGYLIREGPSMRASEYIAEEVISCEKHEQLYKIGEKFLHHFIRPFIKTNIYCMPTPSCPSCQMRDTPCKSLCCQCNAKETALLRDGNQCLVTGIYDYEMECDKQVRLSHSQCTHIFPVSISSNILGANECATSFWAIMKCFGYEDILKKLMGNDLWFEAIDGQKNTYNIVGVHSDNFLPNPVTLTSQDPNFPLPNPTYLRIHAACGRVADLSGAAKYIQKTFEYLEETGVMSQDGSSAHALMFSLQPLSQEIIL